MEEVWGRTEKDKHTILKKKENKIKQNKSFSNNFLKPLQWNQEANN